MKDKEGELTQTVGSLVRCAVNILLSQLPILMSKEHS